MLPAVRPSVAPEVSRTKKNMSTNATRFKPAKMPRRPPWLTLTVMLQRKLAHSHIYPRSSARTRMPAQCNVSREVRQRPSSRLFQRLRSHLARTGDVVHFGRVEKGINGSTYIGVKSVSNARPSILVNTEKLIPTTLFSRGNTSADIVNGTGPMLNE